MKNLKPGQLATIRNTLYRATKRIDGCKGCDLNDDLMCPNIRDKRFAPPVYNCELCDIIFKAVK